MPCRSDKTRSGMARFGHLADGRVKLVLVRKCSPLQVRAFAPPGAHSCVWATAAHAGFRNLNLSIRTCLRRRAAHPHPTTAHLACPPQYLRFLHSMSRHGCAPGQLPHVTVLDAVAVEVTPLGGSSGGGVGVGLPTSCWNLDGELVAGPDIQAEVHPGLVRVFSRGMEQA